jgi:hypothetical protein
MREKRINDISVLGLDGSSASSRIVNHLNKEFHIHDK